MGIRFSESQIFGSLAVLAVLNILGIFLAARNPAVPVRDIPFLDDGPGRAFVEIAGDTQANGIYFVPQGTTIGELLDRAEITVKGGWKGDGALAEKLRDGTKLVVNSPSGLKLGNISNARRFGLRKPMDLNSVSERELMLVPGIGGKTAHSILEARGAAGRFSSVDDLGDVSGIGPRKLEKFREYFFVRSGS